MTDTTNNADSDESEDESGRKKHAVVDPDQLGLEDGEDDEEDG